MSDVWCSSTTARVWVWLLFGLLLALPVWYWSTGGDVGMLRH